MPASLLPPPKPRPPRLQNDPDRYIRRVKGGLFQVRPYCPITGQRYDLGELFRTIGAARKARDDFWWGGRPDADYVRFTKRVGDGDRYVACVVVRADLLRGALAAGGRERETLTVGPFATRAEAAAAARGVLAAVCGPLFAAHCLAARGDGKASWRERHGLRPGNPPG